MSNTAVGLLRLQSEASFREFVASFEGVDRAQAWGVLPQTTEEYLHTDGSIHSLVLHVATGKVMYASAAFKNLEIRWRDLAEELESFEPDWDAAQEYLKASHQYWTEAWAHLTDDDLYQDVLRPQGDHWPAWKVLHTLSHHDAYHAGQIAVLRFAGHRSDSPPPSVAEDVRKYCAELPSW
ncbi:MAG: DinB family protein [Armatimonadetes bacterium]|nr:DinB family protein [Armatimonadota bacterium]